MIIQIKPLSRDNLIKILNKIKLQENIIIDDLAQDFIVNISNNIAKILINYMEKFKLLDQPITIDLAKKVCTNISFCILYEYTELLKNKRLDKAIKMLYEIYDKGYSVMDILDNYFLFVKMTDSLEETQKYNIIPIICKYITIFYNIHEDEIELALFSNNIYNIINN
jgi:DNA polymerase III gamma/tau subunit